MIFIGPGVGKTFGFKQSFGFPAVDWVAKWTKTVNFQCVTFEPNFKILKDFSNNVFVLLDYLKFLKKFQISIWSRSNNNWGIKSQKIRKRGHLMDAESIQETLKIFSFGTTYAILMELTINIYLNKVFHLGKSCGVIHRV